MRARLPTDCCRLAATAAELDAHFAVRRAVFVDEQALFADSDRDEFDAQSGTLHVVGVVGDAVCGAVRLYPLDADGLWKGDRLAVLAEHRLRLGASLVRFAVATAAARGGTRMVANVQVGNVRFFEWLGWEAMGPAQRLHGALHVPVAIMLVPGSAP